MINPFKEVNWKPDLAAKKGFAKSLMMGFPILGLISFLGRGAFGVWDGSFSLALAGIGLGAGLLFWLAPAMAGPFYLVWMGLACCIGIVVGNVLLTVFYYVVVTGIGLVLRALGKRTIAKGPQPGVKTYWRETEKITDVKRYFRQF